MGIDHPTRPYAFDRIFAQSAIDATRNPQDLALQLHAMQAEMDRQRDGAQTELVRARADGFASGLAQARAETAAALLSAATAVADGLDRLEALFVEAEARIAGVAADVVLTAAELLAAQAVAQTPGRAIDAAIARVLTQTGFRETLHVHVHPDGAAGLRELLAERQGAEQRPLTVTIHDDPRLPPGDANILWDQGGLSLDSSARNSAVRNALGLGAVQAVTAS